MRPLLIAITLALLALPSPEASAHRAHEHGVAHLELLREGRTIELQLRADGQAMVGFERAPRDEAERARQKAASQALASALPLLGLPAAAACRQVDAKVAVPHAGDADGHAHDEDDAGDHADWHASYRFECGDPESATRVDLAGLFRAFPSLTRVELQWITEDAQSGTTLVPGRSQAALESP